MENRLDLTNGSIGNKLIKLSLPIMGTSFIQMAYNLVDMLWVGKAGSDAVAAVGTAGFFPWLSMAFIMLSRVGGEVKVAQSVGENNINNTKLYIKSALENNIILSILFSMVVIIFNKSFIDIFKLGNESVILMSRQYLVIVSFGFFFFFLNQVLTGIFNGLGNSKTPFLINTVGLVTNIVLDPILIFGLFGMPKLGVAGAAIATISAQIVSSIIFLYKIKKSNDEYFKIKLFKNMNIPFHKDVIKIGIPVAIQNGMFTLISMVIGILIASWGSTAIAAQKVGSQIESISWMTSDGLSVAITSFIGQNYGANKFDRVKKGCKAGILSALLLGVITTLILVFGGGIIFSLFINEQDAIIKGGMYLKILGYTQIFNCLEIIICGIFKGLGRTYISSVVVTVLTSLRIPMAYVLSNKSILGLNGIWWSISISTFLKGTLLMSIFIYLYKNEKLYLKANLKESYVSCDKA